LRFSKKVFERKSPKVAERIVPARRAPIVKVCKLPKSDRRRTSAPAAWAQHSEVGGQFLQASCENYFVRTHMRVAQIGVLAYLGGEAVGAELARK
jgi:hypothetical protein